MIDWIVSLKVLFVASECSPFIKTGGLADVIGSIPKALATDGIEVKVLIPAYRALQGLAAAGRTLARYDNLFGGKAEIKSISAEELELLLLVAPHLYDRGGNMSTHMEVIGQTTICALLA